MVDFKIGDRVKIVGIADWGKTGVIVDKGDEPCKILTRNVRKPKDEIVTCWWKVKLDETGEEKDFFDDHLELVG